MSDIAIVGAGIMGRVLAWRLLREGSLPVLFDRDPIASGSAAAYTAAGMLAPYCELESAEDLVFRMGMAGLPHWEELSRQLERDVGYRSEGSLVVSHPQDRADLERFRRILDAKLAQSERGYRRLDAAALREAEPELAEHFTEALYLPGESWVNNLEVMAVLAKKLLEAGISWHADTPVERVEAGRVHTPAGVHEFDWVVDCRGRGAGPQMAALRGVRGELMQVRAPEVRIRHMVRLMHPRYRLYLVPGQDDSYILGATQIESEDDSPLSVRSALELLSALYTLHTGFAEARIIGTRSNVRPALPDNLPRVESAPGLVRINGLFRHGFLLSPLLAQQVAGMLLRPRNFAPEFAEVFFEIETG